MFAASVITHGVAERMVSTAFSPKTEPRPAYPAFSGVLSRWAWVLLRDVILGLALSHSAFPWYSYLGGLVSERACFALTICGAHTITYIAFNGTLQLLENCQWEPLMKCRIGRKTMELPDKPLVKQLLTEAAINHFVTSPITAALLFTVVKWCGMPPPTEPLPPVANLALLFVAAHTFNDFGFYWTHRLLHHRLFYGTFHKQHHAFKGTIGAAAEFAHPLEAVLSNQIPTVGMLLAIGAHPLVQGVWLVLRLTQTYEVHSGYDFSESLVGKLGLTANESSFHDHHHTYNVGNFGAEHTDWLFGTMDHYLRDGGRAGYMEKRKGESKKAQ